MPDLAMPASGQSRRDRHLGVTPRGAGRTNSAAAKRSHGDADPERTSLAYLARRIGRMRWARAPLTASSITSNFTAVPTSRSL